MHDPGAWLGSSPLLDLDHPKLRLRAQALTQLSRSEHEKAVAVYGFVKRIPFSVGFKMRLHTAHEVLTQPGADSADKATLLVALLRLAGVPARLRYLTMDGRVLRGLLHTSPDPAWPVVEAWRGGRWVGTDTFIFDGAYVGAARQRLAQQGWERGFGVHVHAPTLWDGNAPAYLGGSAPQDDPLLVHDHGLFCDPLEFESSPSYREVHGRFKRSVQHNVLSHAVERGVRQLREGCAVPQPA